ncbi:cytochrome c biogenesis protein CcdA [Lysinibacillus sp. CD3-6]|uniref:cytochrome c biogenesis protein CcdA n=1 Tax=Lysinibacillus sp. CD3-6 TaxID=2892541 RepID=UPI001D1708F5|nr:cytochrome c biogenesis protein CcdA [Lysinibacillus sp. CD3-6]UED80278.1 cytochrome c biogenesis protein CcdA [Lysinibacillus sp. CD3-6]
MDEQLLFSTVFIAGILSFLSPCIVPLLPVYFSVLSTNASGVTIQHSLPLFKWQVNLHLVFKTIIFVFGLSTSFVILGFGAGFLGAFINTDWFIAICGAVVVLLGLHQIGLLKVAVLHKETKVRLSRSDKRDLLGTYLLGLTFSMGWTPCIGPILGAVLGLSASEGQAAYGALMMFFYALGLLIPFLLLAIFSDFLLRHVKKLNKHTEKIKVIGGLIIIFMGIVLMTNNLNLLLTFIPQ